jgi:hypothetical protein
MSFSCVLLEWLVIADIAVKAVYFALHNAVPYSKQKFIGLCLFISPVPNLLQKQPP